VVGDVFNDISELAASGHWFSSSELAERTGISRQAVHLHLRRAVEAGLLVVSGKGRATRYRGARPPTFQAELPTLGLAEDRVWERAREALADLSNPENANARSVATYAFTEMLNNAIDHSGSPTVRISAGITDGLFWFEITDHGIGIFEHVRAKLELSSRLEALQEISKGKTTTLPDRHTGEGIFFTSKVADHFEITANGLRWEVDNLRGDQAVGSGPDEPGTRVRFEVALSKHETLEAVFSKYTHDLAFDTTRTVVKLFSYGVRFVSRSEAKRLLNNLDRFRHVILDFAGVEAVGQGFADEVFRVWANDHPEIEITAENMAEPVAFMIDRARRR